MSLPSWLDIDFSGVLPYFEAAQDYLLNLSTATMLAYLLLFFLVIWGISLFKRYLGMQGERHLDPAKAAEAAVRSQDPLQAGELFERAQAYHQAIEAYKSAKAFQEVGRVYELLREWDDAAQFYSISGNTEKAAIMYQKGGDYLRAAESYLRCSKNLLAAEMFEKARKYEEAAAQYEKFGKSLKAAQLFQQSGHYEKAAEKYERYFLKQNIVASNLSLEKQKQIKKAALESGSLYMKVKQFKKAMDIFAAAGISDHAAEAATQAGEIEKAAQFYLSSRAFEKAAALFRSMGDKKQAHWIMAKKHQEDHDFIAAGEAFERGEGWTEAAEMFEQGGDESAAGRMYQQAGDYHRSADLFLASGDRVAAAASLERGGRLQEATDLYVQLGRFDRAAQMQELIGNYYEAALLFKDHGDLDRCISYLQRVGSDSSQHTSATLLLGKLFTERGMIPAAKDCFQKLVSENAAAPENIEVYYRLAILHESDKAFEEAARLYEDISSVDFNYKDVKHRSALLKKALAEVKKALALPPEGLKLPQEAVPEKALVAENPPQETRYQRLRKIGEGGMGVVYLAEDTVLRRRVAYKVLPASIRENASVLQNFMQEARIAAALNHPNIVTVFDTGKDGDDIYITMEYIDGLSLKQYLERHQTSLDERIKIMKSICHGVAYAHDRRVVHRDLKPTNVMLQGKTVKIMDFGLAKRLTDTMTERTSIKGTPLYMSPEQIVGGKVDKLSDIYALGCTFYRMLTGRPPFSKGDVYYQHLHAKPTPLRAVNPEIPLGLEKIVLKCIEKRKDRRLQSVDDILSALSGLAKDPLTASHANPDVEKRTA